MFKLCRFLLLLLPLQLFAQQKPPLNYYLPEIQYNPAIPTPEQYLGYAVGEWHVTHDQLVAYMRELASKSDRISIQEYGRSHEHRPLLCLTITAPENHSRIDEIRSQRRQLADPAVSGRLDPGKFPAVAYMGYSIHGNEASGSNAALLVAYYLAAGQTPELESFLKNTVILLDPCFNPDGLQRFSTWVNSRRSQSLMPDPAHDEFNENWPSGRTNHYWFDLNRDWLVAQQPETAGRVAIFQDWLPNTLTDHHEMGSNSTFFFQPGVPSRVHPITPARNQELTAKIATYHARILSEHKVLFFSGENYDDFYYGKGSTYPDVNGCMGILFEQASSRGSAQETDNGLLTFPYTIRNQVFTSLSTMQALRDMRVELNSYLRDFFKSALDEAARDNLGGYLFGSPETRLQDREFIRLLLRHNIQVRKLEKSTSASDMAFDKNNAWVVPLEQPNYRLVKSIFERRTSFPDSIFYDISAWTLPDAFGLNWANLDRKSFQALRLGARLSAVPELSRSEIPRPNEDTYAYLIENGGYDLPRLLSDLHRADVRVQVATRPFVLEGKQYAAGSLLVPMANQKLGAGEIQNCMLESGAQDIRVHAIANGLTEAGPDLGSNNFVTLRAPNIALVTGRGAGTYETGEVWHLLDTRYGLTPLLIDVDRFSRVDLGKYNVVILADGNFGQIAMDHLRAFVNGGGTIIATGASLRWLKSAGLAGLDFRNIPNDGPASERRPYSHAGEDRRSRRLPGAIFEIELDLTSPLCYGYDKPRIPMFLGDAIFLEKTKNPYAMPAVFTDEPLMAGYLHPQQRSLISGAAAIAVAGSGRGRVICFPGNPNFRAFWYGTNRLFANAIFFGNLISGSAVER